MARAVMAEFSSPEALARSIRWLRERGFDALDAYTPYPVDDVLDALELRPSPIPWLVLAGALCGGALAYLVQWFTTAIEYRLDVGGRPFHPWPSFVPITYELATLFGALTGFVAFFVLARLPRPWHPVFETHGFESVSSDRHWLRIDRFEDHRWAPEALEALPRLGATRVVVEEAP